jgi:hypothetical protein
MTARRLWAVVVAALIAVAVAACGSSSSSNSTANAGKLAVSPSSPHPSSVITFSFVAPVRAGRDGKVINSYSLSVTGPAGEACKGSQEAAGSPVDQGQTSHIAIGPSQLHANWCVGPYTARVFEIQRPYCKPGTVCPQYVHVAGIVAKTSFTVSK